MEFLIIPESSGFLHRSSGPVSVATTAGVAERAFLVSTGRAAHPKIASFDLDKPCCHRTWSAVLCARLAGLAEIGVANAVPTAIAAVSGAGIAVFGRVASGIAAPGDVGACTRQATEVLAALGAVGQVGMLAPNPVLARVVGADVVVVASARWTEIQAAGLLFLTGLHFVLR